MIQGMGFPERPGFSLEKSNMESFKVGLVFILSLFVFFCGVRLTIQSKSNSTEEQTWEFASRKLKQNVISALMM